MFGTEMLQKKEENKKEMLVLESGSTADVTRSSSMETRHLSGALRQVIQFNVWTISIHVIRQK